MRPISAAPSSQVYAAYGLALASPHHFPELRTTDRRPDYHVRWDCDVTVLQDARWSVLWRSPSGEPWAQVARAAGRRCVRFPRYMTVCATSDRLNVVRRGHASDDTLRHLLLDQVLPLILSAQGRIVLHASAVLLGRRAVLLAGEAGAGKSTLAARLAAAGATVLADDGVLLQDGRAGLEVIPSYAGLRLFEDSAAAAGYHGADSGPLAEYTTKRRFVAAGSSDPPSGAYPLGPVCILHPGDEDDLHVAPLSRRDATVALLRHAYRADLADRAALREQFDTLSGLSSRLRVWRFHFPRRLGEVSRVAATLAGHVCLPGEPL